MVYGASTGYGMPSALDVTCHAGRCVPGGLGATCRTEALRGLSAATLLTLRAWPSGDDGVSARHELRGPSSMLSTGCRSLGISLWPPRRSPERTASANI